MKSRSKWVFILLTILCCMGFVAYLYMMDQITDQTAPTISFESEELELSVSATEEDLLADVSAYDDEDGDVTSSLVVEGISNLSSDQTATVTYAAFDQAGNIAKAQRVVYYTDYQSPHFSLSAPLIFRSGVDFDLFDYIGAEDVFDGSLDNNIKATLVSDTGSVTDVGTHEVQFRVTNSMGDTAYLTLPVEVYEDGAYNATLELSTYLVYLEVGDSFDSESYLKTMKVNGEEISLTETPDEVSIDIDSDVNTRKAGVYSVTYTVTYTEASSYRTYREEEEAEYIGYTRLIVVVEE